MCRIWATQSCWVNSYFPWVYSLQRWLLKVREMLLKSEDRKHHHSSAQKPWASLVGQTGKNPPSMREIQVQSLGWEDPLEKEMATYSRILAWRISMGRGIWQATVHGATKKSDLTEQLTLWLHVIWLPAMSSFTPFAPPLLTRLQSHQPPPCVSKPHAHSCL